MSRLYALKGRAGLITYQGRVLAHTSREELEFLFPCNPVVDVTGTGQPIMWVQHHPQCQSVTFPIDKARFDSGPRHLLKERA